MHGKLPCSCAILRQDIDMSAAWSKTKTAGIGPTPMVYASSRLHLMHCKQKCLAAPVTDVSTKLGASASGEHGRPGNCKMHVQLRGILNV